MAIAITIPRLGWTMEQGVFAGWFKQDGDAVKIGDRLFSLESDKATDEVEALDGGVLRIPPDGPQPGATVRVGLVIGFLLQPGEAAADMQTPPAAAPTRVEPSVPASPSVRQLARARGIGLRAVTGTGPNGRIMAEDLRQSSPVREPVARTAQGPGERAPAAPTISPRALRVAAELGVDWACLRGSGRTGRIRECDVRAAVTRTPPVPRPTAAGHSRTRRIIAERMLHSVRSTAPVTLTSTADATNLVNLREQFRAVAGVGPEPIPSYTDFLVKLAAAALRQHPHLNARWEDEGVVLEQAVHIGIAVDTEAGLLVPVVRDVPALSLRQLAAHTRDLIDRARQWQLRADEMQGGTFTISNLGGFGIDAFTPIIQVPQCAILGIGRIQRQPVVFQDQIAVRERITLSLTFDHRIVDGAPAARFVQTLVALVENPGPALLE